MNSFSYGLLIGLIWFVFACQRQGLKKISEDLAAIKRQLGLEEDGAEGVRPTPTELKRDPDKEKKYYDLGEAWTE